MNKQDFERLLSGEYLSGQASAAAPVGRSGYATERAMKDTVRRTDAEMAADTATNQNPAVFAELEREYQNAKDPSIKAILAEEIRRQQGAAPAGFAQHAPATGQDIIAPAVRSGAGAPNFAGDQKRRDVQAKADASPVSTSLGRGWERTKQMASDTVNLATGDAEGVRQNALDWQKYDEANPQPTSAREFMEGHQAAGDSVGGMLRNAAGNLGGLGLSAVEQITNSLPSMAGSIVGAAKGASVGFGAGGPLGALAGSMIGGIVGATPGSFMIEPGAKVAEAMAESGVDLANPDAVKDWFSANQNELIEKGLLKAGGVAMVDGLMGGIGQAIVAKPALAFAAAQNRALAKIGVNAGDKAAVAAARQMPEYRALMAQPARDFLEATTIAKNAMRGTASFAAETFGEGAGEYWGEYLAEGEGNFNEAMLESLTAGVTSVATTGAQYGASKVLFGPDQTVEEIKALAAIQVAEQQPAAPQPNSPLSNAAQAAKPVDPFAEMLAPITERLSDREIYAKIRGTESLGPNALSDILASYRVATNTQADPMQRQAAIARLSEFLTAFDSIGTNFPAAPRAPGSVGFANPASSNESTAEPGGTQRRLPHNPDANAIDGQSRVVFDPRLPQPPTAIEGQPGPLVSRTPATSEVANRVNNGWGWDGNASLVSPDGQTYPMNVIERQFMKTQAAKATPKMLPEPPEVAQLRNALRKMTIDEIADDLLADPSLEPAFKAAIGPQAWGLVAGRAAELAAQRNGSTNKGDGYAAQPQQVAQEAPQANGPQAGAEQAAAPAGEIESLRKQLEAAEPFTEESMVIQDRLQAAVTADAISSIESGSMPVYQVGQNSFVTISPSAQSPGKVQVTRYNNNGVFGDSQYNSVEDAIRSEGLWVQRRMSDDEAGAAFQQSLRAESEYQSNKQTAPAEQPARDLTGRTDTQLANLVASGSTPEIRAAARAEIARRAQVGDINVVESNQAEAKRMPLSVGLAPGATEPVTVQNGVVHIGKYPAQDFDTGEDVTVPDGATDRQIVDALRAAGAIAPNVKAYGVSKDAGSEKPKQKPNRNTIDTAKDSALVAIAKLGGIDTQQLLANGFDQSDISVQKGARVSKKTGQLGKAPFRAKQVGFNMPIHRNGGMGLDGVREALVQRGYLPEGASVNDVMDLLHQELRGEPVYTVEAVESQVAEAEAARQAEMEASEFADEQVDFEAESNAELRAINAAYDALSDDKQAFIRGMRKAGASDEEINGYIADFERVREGDNDGAEASQAGGGESRSEEGDFDGEALGGKESAEPDWLSDGPAANAVEQAEDGFGLTGQTDEEAAAEAQSRANDDDDALTIARIDAERDAVPFSLAQQSQPRPQGVQTGLFTADGRVSADAAMPPKDQGATAFAEGKERKAPESLSSANKVRWFVGYDEAKKAAGDFAVGAADQAEAKPKKSSAEWLAEDGSDYKNHVASDAEQLVIQVQEEYREDDFNASDIPSVIADWAKDSRFKVEDLQTAFLKELDRSGFIPQKIKADIRAAVDASNQPKPEAEREELPPTDIRIGDTVFFDGHDYTVTAGIEGGIAATREASRNGGVTQESTIFLRGDDAIRAKIAADKRAAVSAGAQTDAERYAAIKSTPPLQRTQADVAWVNEYKSNLNNPAREAAAKAEQAKADDAADTDGYAESAGKNDALKQKIRNALNKNILNNGRLTTRKNLVRDRVSAGAVVDIREGQRALVSSDGAYLLESAITKTGIDYAEHMIGKRDAQAKPKAEPAAVDNQKDDKYAEAVARYKEKQAERAIVPLSEITVTRDATLDGRPVEYDQRADEAIAEIDNELTLAKQLLDCLAS